MSLDAPPLLAADRQAVRASFDQPRETPRLAATKLLALVLSLVAFLPLATVADESPDPEPKLPRNKAAIGKGVAYLKKAQLANGSWENAHALGMAALPGLTLLECGVKADDPAVQKAAKYVRDNAAKRSVAATYECSLALLFLDRLGDAKDRPLVRTLALRLVAGQLPGGGWSYTLPELSAQEERDLIDYLAKTRPERDKGLGAFYKALEDKDGGRKVKDGESKKGVKPLSEKEAKDAFDKLPAKVRNAPAVSEPTGAKPVKVGNAGDNSNTQFATLALWAARRHEVPVERTLDAVGKRFGDSQGQAGTWGYQATNPNGTPAMTGAGLLGLAVGHGSATDPERRFSVKDARIDKGLGALGKHVGNPKGRQPINLYFLWTVGRVGLLYDVREMDGKDWYAWGVELLLPAQADEGSWQQGGFAGATKSVETSFALLFLRRSNPASDLTRRLDFAVEGRPKR